MDAASGWFLRLSGRTYALPLIGVKVHRADTRHSWDVKHPNSRFLSVRIAKVCRHRGDSFSRQVAYIWRSIAVNPRTGQQYDFRKAGPVEATGLVGWKGEPEELIVAATFAERRQKAVEGRVAILALPHEFTRKQRLAVVEDCAERLAKKFHVAVVFAIHPPPEDGDERNWHAHLLFTSRRVEGRTLGRKTRELDSFKTGGKHVEEFRATWCSGLNALLLKNGHRPNVEHKSFARLGVKAKPTRHRGERQTAIIRKRVRTASLSQPATIAPRENLRPLPIPVVGPFLRPLPTPNLVPKISTAPIANVLSVTPTSPAALRPIAGGATTPALSVKCYGLQKPETIIRKPVSERRSGFMPLPVPNLGIQSTTGLGVEHLSPGEMPVVFRRPPLPTPVPFEKRQGADQSLT